MSRLHHCCCFSVRTGTLIMATMGLLGGISSVFTYSYMLSGPGQEILQRSLGQFEYSLAQMEEQGVISPKDYEQIEYYVQAIRESGLRCVFTGILIFSSFQLGASALLLIGTAKKNTYLMIPGIIWYSICFIIKVIVIVTVVVVAFMYGSIGVGLPLALIYSFVLAMIFYFWLVIYSHYKELKEFKRLDQQDKIPFVVDEVPPPYDEN